MRVGVTGGAGFIGTHLCRALVVAGHDVRVLDLRAPKEKIAKVKYTRGDVRVPKTVRAWTRRLDAVYHLAAIASIPLCEQDPLGSTQTNLTSTALLLENLPRGARFIFAGTSAVYGNSGRQGHRLTEDGRLPEPQSYYAAQKFGSELLIRQFHRSRGVPAVVFRFFNVYGPGQDPRSPYTGVITAFKESMSQERPLRLNGGGKQTRDFIFVGDIVQGLMAALRCPASRCDGQAINLGTGRAISIAELAKMMRRVKNSEVPLSQAPWREGDVKHSCAEISRARQVLGWKPRVDLENGLKTEGFL